LSISPPPEAIRNVTASGNFPSGAVPAPRSIAHAGKSVIGVPPHYRAYDYETLEGAGILEAMREATEEDLEIFDSLRERRCPPGHFIGDGERVVRKMLAHGEVVKVVCTPEWAGRLPVRAGVDVRTAPRERLDQLVGFRLHQGLMALAKIPAPRPLGGALLVALDGLANAENVGSVLRACAAFGAEGVLVGPGTASPWLRRAVRVSLAAPLVVPVRFTDDLASSLRTLNAWAAHIHGPRVDYREVDLSSPCCIVLGGEDKGVTAPVLAACRGVLTIPMSGDWDCLNVASTAAVLLAEARRQKKQGC
jgi:tRNA G18 (ribose-2'-O)-methylase SpoU